MTWRVDRSEAFGGASFATSRLRIPWAPDEGLFIFDQFGGGSPLEVPLPDALVGRGTFPYVILSCHDGDTAFLAQRWFDRPIAAWHLHGEVGVDSASVCITPRSIAERISGRGLAEAEKLVHDAPDLWAQVALEGRPLLGIRTTLGDGSFPLQIALDAASEPIGWVLELGLAQTT
jgi:hypothetical protein